MRVLLPLLWLLLLGTFAPLSLRPDPITPARSRLYYQSIPLDAAQPARRSVGQLTLLGGWWIRSDDPRFGGLSAMNVENGSVLAFSDAGHVMRLGLPEGDGRAVVRIRALTAGPGPRTRKRNRDVEAMAVMGGKVWLAFEYRDAVWRYDRRSWRGEAGTAPPAMQAWPRNGGAEAMLRLSDGRFILFSEDAEGPDGTTEALLFDGDPSEADTLAVPLRYRSPPGYRVTDAAALGDGRFVFLHRRVSPLRGFSTKLTIAKLPPLERGAVVEGREIATLAPPLVTANFEALSVTRENGRDTVWVASDDNYSPLLRTILLKFALAD